MAKILIVDDSPTETYKLTNILERNGFSVLSADSGEQGVNLAKDEQPDVVLMDIVMPGLNGFQATRQLSRSKETKHIPVIIVTAKNQQADQVWVQDPQECTVPAMPEAVIQRCETDFIGSIDQLANRISEDINQMEACSQ